MRNVLRAILALALIGIGLAGVVRVFDESYRRGFADGKLVVDSIRDEAIYELLESWGRCEMSKPGHIVFPSDTATRLLYR